MKGHILAALREQLENWEKLIACLSDEQITTPRWDYDWSIQDVVAHLWGWQQVSTARIRTAQLNRTPGSTRFHAHLRPHPSRLARDRCTDLPCAPGIAGQVKSLRRGVRIDQREFYQFD